MTTGARNEQRRLTGITNAGLDAFDRLVALSQTPEQADSAQRDQLALVVDGLLGRGRRAKLDTRAMLDAVPMRRNIKSPAEARRWAVAVIAEMYLNHRPLSVIDRKTQLPSLIASTLVRLRSRSALSKLLTDLRMDAGLSVTDAAASAGVALPYWRGLETGTRRMEPEDALAIATAFGVGVGDLMEAAAGEGLGAQVDASVAARIEHAYWETEESHASIARRFGLSQSPYRLVTPRPADRDCRACGTAEVFRSRSARQHRWATCPQCSGLPITPSAEPQEELIALHGTWASGLLWVWGESTRDWVIRRGHPKAAHPFAVSPEVISEMLSSEGLETSLQWRWLPVELPSEEGQPQASPLVPRAAGPAIGSRRWEVPAGGLEARQVLGFLRHLDDLDEAVVGSSLRFFAGVARTALSLVAEGRVLPAMAGGSAMWEPVDDGRLAVLEARMPDVCSAVPGTGLRATLRSFAGAVTDTLARDLLAPHVDEWKAGEGGEASSPGRAFARALSGPDAVVHAEPSAVEELEATVRGWRSGQHRPDALRLCFRLSEPTDSHGWRLDLLVRDVAEATVLVPAAEIWEGWPSLGLLQRREVHPEEWLAHEVGQMAREFPPLARALAVERRVASVDLDTAEVLALLQVDAQALERAGAEVLLPAWWRKPRQALGARLHVRTPAKPSTSSGLFGMDGLCNFRWELAIGDEVMTVEEMEELARIKLPLVQVRGRWVQLNAKEMAAATALVEGRDVEGWDGSMTVAEVTRTQLGMGLDPGLPLVGVSATGWLGQVIDSMGSATIEAVPTPASFLGTLRDYQERGLAWLCFLDRLGLGGCLADDMGLGKTPQLLAFLVAEREAEPSAAATLLACPMSLLENWEEEAEFFTPSLKVYVHHGERRLHGEAFRAKVAASDLVLTSYALVVRDEEDLASVHWRRVVLDEAQDVNNYETRQAKAVRRLPADRRLALTGTPIENHLSELWSILDFCNPGLLGDRATFRRVIAGPVERRQDEEMAALLRQVISPFVLRRKKDDRTIITDLPLKDERVVACHLTSEQASLYQAVVDDMLVEVDAAEDPGARRFKVLAALTKLKQVCNHPAQYLKDSSLLAGRSGKLVQLDRLVDEAMATEERVLVFTQYVEMGSRLQSYLQARLGREVLWMHGATSKRQRGEMRRRFMAEDGPPVMVMTIKVGGRGLNLTRANHVVHFDRWWNPAVEDQASDRAYRIGQTRPVFIRSLVCQGTLEERIDELLRSKRSLAERSVGTGEEALTELSTDALRELVALGATATGRAA